uniref:Uncharacterized protein n=1 Tax=Strongyloides papillosus TaxID=174720 RepID=A0A0N5B3Z5_STREA
MPRSPVRA